MDLTLPIKAPACYVPPYAMAFASSDSIVRIVDADHPLPVTAKAIIAATSTPLQGTSDTVRTVGPFNPELARSIWLTLSGNWSGSATLLRSTDGGTTRMPLTIGGTGWASFTANCNEVVAEESDANASYWLQLNPTAGTINYRVAQ